MRYFRSVFTTVLCILYIHDHIISKKTEIENLDFFRGKPYSPGPQHSRTHTNTDWTTVEDKACFLIYKAHKLNYTPTITY